MAASKVIKEEGGENDLLERIAADEAFGVTLEELEAILEPEQYVGRAPEQVVEFIEECVVPVCGKLDEKDAALSEVSL
jgi:adenylosuccinate lyase